MLKHQRCSLQAQSTAGSIVLFWPDRIRALSPLTCAMQPSAAKAIPRHEPCAADAWPHQAKSLSHHETNLCLCSNTALQASQPQTKAEPDTAAYPHSSSWQWNKTAGPQFARLNGDRNPIHMSPLWARLFGFKSNIAHGQHCLSRVHDIIASGTALGECTLYQVKHKSAE